ncbi:carboxymuconolactone decarboxylase family protein [Rhodovulum sp. 12E13]|uniref:carboxymuconolactone decarboxylase family protein n=1 Tax=Rhodovulum sp. 12E13 TaxID=2203891 RepID=UPI000E1A51EE|nr:carboxymuconolactone decarboxylase family protein [Rhodovulum sp. 12E13]RDC71910.1 carboxymuconolactone decarboxylase family protein [Rhodovulum sp. 12E13]
MVPDYSKVLQHWMETGAQMARAANPAMETFRMPALDEWFPTMPRDALEMTMGKTFNPDGLDAKTRLLVTLAALTVIGGHAEDQIRITVRHALEAGATPQEVAETIGQMAMFGGVPAMQKAMEAAREVIADRTEKEAGDDG